VSILDSYSSCVQSIHSPRPHGTNTSLFPADSPSKYPSDGEVIDGAGIPVAKKRQSSQRIAGALNADSPSKPQLSEVSPPIEQNSIVDLVNLGVRYCLSVNLLQTMSCRVNNSTRVCPSPQEEQAND